MGHFIFMSLVATTRKLRISFFEYERWVVERTFGWFGSISVAV